MTPLLGTRAEQLALLDSLILKELCPEVKRDLAAAVVFVLGDVKPQHDRGVKPCAAPRHRARPRRRAVPVRGLGGHRYTVNRFR